MGNFYLEGTWSEVYPEVTRDESGLKRLFRQFLFPGGISSRVAPTTPGSILEGGELGYSLGDNASLIVACVIGDREAETARWRRMAVRQVPRPVTDGAVLPILNLNGYKISNPPVLARIERGVGAIPLRLRLATLLRGRR